MCFLAASTRFLMARQNPAYPQTPTFRVQSSPVLVDVMSQNRKSGLPIRDLKKDDFRPFDNRHEVPISTFDAGARYDTRCSSLSGLGHRFQRFRQRSSVAHTQTRLRPVDLSH